MPAEDNQRCVVVSRPRRWSDREVSDTAGDQRSCGAARQETGHSVAALIDDQRIAVWSDKVPRPVAVRYARANNPTPTLFGKTDLPATPFRTDVASP